MKLKLGILNNWKEKNVIHDQKMEGGSSKKEQPAGVKRGGKIQKLIAVGIGKQYLNSLKEIGKEWRFWVRISDTIPIEQKR
jgi:hypothetical protein